jgi:hypothetical protein
MWVMRGRQHHEGVGLLWGIVGRGETSSHHHERRPLLFIPRHPVHNLSFYPGGHHSEYDRLVQALSPVT